MLPLPRQHPKLTGKGVRNLEIACWIGLRIVVELGLEVSRVESDASEVKGVQPSRSRAHGLELTSYPFLMLLLLFLPDLLEL
jgi:hypothetical protein